MQLSLLLFGFGGLIFLMLLRVPVGIAMIAVGGVGYVSQQGLDRFLNLMKAEPYYNFASYDLIIIPIFLLMGQFATMAGLSRALFRFARHWFGHFRGGLSMASVVSCTLFGAICGSSLATASTVGRVAIPEMTRYGYPKAHAASVIAAGGTMGILVPPSLILIIYAILTEQSLGKLFMAALLPACLTLGIYLFICWLKFRQSQIKLPPSPWKVRFLLIRHTLPVFLIFGLLLGGIYSGLFTPTRGAAVAACLTFLVALYRRKVTVFALKNVFIRTAEQSAMIFLILLGAKVFSHFLALTDLSFALSDWVAETQLSPWQVLVGILLFYLCLGCLMDSLSMIILTVPLLFPVFMELDFGMVYEAQAIWFGILVLIVVEIGLITPPIGLNLFIIHKEIPSETLMNLYREIFPFLFGDISRVLIIMVFPVITYGIL